MFLPFGRLIVPRKITKKNLTLLLFVLVLSICFSQSIEAAKISKQNAKYTGKALVEYDTMFRAGEWFMIMLQCEGAFAKKYKPRLASLSWNDYKTFNAGHNKYASGNYQVTKCDKKQTKEIAEWYDQIIVYIKSELKISDNSNKSEKKETTKTKTTNSNSSIKEKLKELKSLFEDGLITQEEYDAKRKEILDDM